MTSTLRGGIDELTERLRAATRGRYDIFSPLGSGGMGVVFAAFDLSLGRRVAIKVMLCQGMMPDAAERFDREVRLSASLSHPNIIPIYSVERTDELHYFVMQFIQGQTFDAVLKSDKEQSPEVARIVLQDIGAALDYAHTRGVVHRDIKPANIMADEGGWAVLMDFGVAKADENSALTNSGFMLGTPAYMAPEYFSDGAFGPKTDQYAMGVVLFQLLANRPAFLGQTAAELMRAHIFDAPPDIRSFQPQCSAELAEAITRMLAKNPEDRFPSFNAASACLPPLESARQNTARVHLTALARQGALLQHKVSERVSPPPFARRSAIDTEMQVNSPYESSSPTNSLRGMASRIVQWAVVGAVVTFAMLISFRTKATGRAVPAELVVDLPKPVPKGEPASITVTFKDNVLSKPQPARESSRVSALPVERRPRDKSPQAYSTADSRAVANFQLRRVARR